MLSGMGGGCLSRCDVWALLAGGAVLVHLLFVGHLARHTDLLVEAAESAHLAAALAGWQERRFDLYPESSPLPHLVAGFPLVLGGFQMPVMEDVDRYGGVAVGRVRVGGGERLAGALVRARLAMLLFSVLAAWAIYHAAAVLWGRRAAAGAVAFWCLHPVVVSWSATLSHDVAGAAAAIWALLATAACVARPNGSGAVLVGAMWACAVLCRATHLVPATVMPLIVAGAAWWNRQGGRRAVGHGLVTAAVALLVINLGYLFQGTGRSLRETLNVPHVVAGATDLFDTPSDRKRIEESFLARIPIPLPGPLVEGLLLQIRDFRRWKPRPGSTFQPGWLWWVEGNARKLPAGLLLYATMGLAFLATVRKTGQTRLRRAVGALFLAWVLYYGWVLSGPGRSIPYLRYSIPVLVVVSVLVSGVLESRLRAVRWVGGLTLVVAAVELVMAFPHTASYFNRLLGGIEAAVGRVAYQDIDNGQDARFARRWVAEHPEARPLAVQLPGIPAQRVGHWGDEVRFGGPARPDEWVVAGIALEAYGYPAVPDRQRRRRVLRLAPAIVIYSPAYGSTRELP